jgi:hypothetical protein
MTVVRLSSWTGCRVPCTGIYITRHPIALWYSSQVKTLDCICTKCSLHTLLPKLNFIHNHSIRMDTDSPTTLCPVYLPICLPPADSVNIQVSIFYIFHSVHYNSITIIYANKCIQLSESYNNIITTINSYKFWAWLAHHQGVQYIL